MRRSSALPALVALLAVAGAACSGDDTTTSTTATTVPGTSTSAPSSTSAPTSSSTSEDGSTGSTSTTPTTAPPPASDACTADQLSGELGGTNSGAGQVYTALVLRNTGSTGCELRGFPGVSLLDGSGNQIGEPAGRDGAEGGTVSLAPGQAASATLHTANEGLGVPCDPASAQLRVFPPDQTESLTVTDSYTACGGFTVTTLVAGETGLP